MSKQANERIKTAWDWKRWKRVPQAMLPGAIQEQIIPSHERLFHPFGVPLLLQTNHPWVLGAAEETLGRFQPSSETGSPLFMRIFVHDAEPAYDYEKGYQPIIYRTHGHLMYITAGAANTAAADLLSGHAFGFITPQMAADKAFVRYAFLDSLTYALIGTVRGFVSFHAGCVVRDRRAIVLCGDAGAGKSTLAFACARRGFQVLAEDALFLDVSGNGTQLWGMPWRIHLLPDSQGLFPELTVEQPRLQINGEWKLEIELEHYFPGATTPDASPGVVVLLERREGKGPSYTEPVPLDEAQDRLRPIWPYWVGWRDEMDAAVTNLLASRTWRLWMNGSPDEAVDALEALLAKEGW